MTEKEAQTLVDGIIPGAKVKRRSRMEQCFVTNDDGTISQVLDASDEVVMAQIDSLHVTIGKFECSFDLSTGRESPELRTLRTIDEIESLLREQLGNVAKEHARKPRSLRELQAARQEKLRADRVARKIAKDASEASKLESMTTREKAAYEYVKKHGEGDFADAYPTIDPIALLDKIVQIGTMSSAEAADETDRLLAWRSRSNRRAEVRRALSRGEITKEESESRFSEIRKEVP